MLIRPSIQQMGIIPYAYEQTSSHIVEKNSMTGGVTTMQEWNANQLRVIERFLQEEKIVRLFYLAVRDEDHFIVHQCDDSLLTTREVIEVVCELEDEDPSYYFEVMSLLNRDFDGRECHGAVVFDRR